MLSLRGSDQGAIKYSLLPPVTPPCTLLLTAALFKRVVGTTEKSVYGLLVSKGRKGTQLRQ